MIFNSTLGVTKRFEKFFKFHGQNIFLPSPLFPHLALHFDFTEHQPEITLYHIHTPTFSDQHCLQRTTCQKTTLFKLGLQYSVHL